MLKPVVFLCHSKKDKDIIISIANDLRACRIDPWYDEWEIPPGKSFQDKIFRDGITQCDCFFIYLTASSIGSYWVNKELDAAFVEQSRANLVDVITFVDSEETRNELRSDIQSLHSPTINNENYDVQFKLIVTAIFEAKINQINNMRDYEADSVNRVIENDRLKAERRHAKAVKSVERMHKERVKELVMDLATSQDKLEAARRELAVLKTERDVLEGKIVGMEDALEGLSKEGSNAQQVTFKKRPGSQPPGEDY